MAFVVHLSYNKSYRAMKVVSIVGMPGAGKSEVARLFEASGFVRIRFGDVTDGEVAKRGLELNEENERYTRELLRQEQGMDAYAKLNLPAIDKAIQHSDVVIDGLYSWEEYTFLKAHYGDGLCLVAIWSSPESRYARLTVRADRGLTAEDAASRDKAEIENVHKGGPIAMADFTIINESFLDDLEEAAKNVISRITE